MAVTMPPVSARSRTTHQMWSIFGLPPAARNRLLAVLRPSLPDHFVLSGPGRNSYPAATVAHSAGSARRLEGRRECPSVVMKLTISIGVWGLPNEHDRIRHAHARRIRSCSLGLQGLPSLYFEGIFLRPEGDSVSGVFFFSTTLRVLRAPYEVSRTVWLVRARSRSKHRVASRGERALLLLLQRLAALPHPRELLLRVEGDAGREAALLHPDGGRSRRSSSAACGTSGTHGNRTRSSPSLS